MNDLGVDSSSESVSRSSVLTRSTEVEKKAPGIPGLGALVGASPAMLELYRQIESMAPTDLTVLIVGETGTGKELVAHALHLLSARASWPIVVLKASSLQAERLESELFGHADGAFSEAFAAREGLAQSAHRGTLLIDEVGDLGTAGQATLLRFLDTRQFRPLGAAAPTQVDVRVVCTTHVDLLAEVERGRFRRDLYYRLRVLALEVPPLRERDGDVALLLDHFLRQFCEQQGRRICGLEEDARGLLLAHRWDGNVRELENEIQRALVMTPDGHPIAREALSPEVRSAGIPHAPAKMGLREHRQQIERQIVIETLERTGWNVTAAARELGISRVGLTKKMKRLGVRRPERRAARRHEP